MTAAADAAQAPADTIRASLEALVNERQNRSVHASLADVDAAHSALDALLLQIANLEEALRQEQLLWSEATTRAQKAETRAEKAEHLAFVAERAIDDRLTTESTDEWLAYRFNQTWNALEAAEARAERAEEALAEARERLSHIQPISSEEWAVLMAEHSVVDEARKISASAGEINTTSDLDRALAKYNAAVVQARAALAALGRGEAAE